MLTEFQQLSVIDCLCQRLMREIISLLLPSYTVTFMVVTIPMYVGLLLPQQVLVSVSFMCKQEEISGIHKLELLKPALKRLSRNSST